MAEYAPIQIRGIYRSPSHVPMWEILDKAGIWPQVGIESVALEYRADPPDAEAELFDGKADFISGDHITPYALVAKGQPIVCLGSPVNGVRDRLITAKPISSLTDLRGKRIADQPLNARSAGFQHPTGNHMLYLIKGGVGLDEFEWEEIDLTGSKMRDAQIEALESGRADACFSTGGTEEYEKRGFHVTELGLLPMINGPTLTTSIDRLHKGDQFGERLVKATVLGIHWAHTHREETEMILEDLRRRQPDLGNVRYQGIERMPAKPYPNPDGITNAYELCIMKDPVCKEVSPLALWDLHYLRELDDSGFIDDLYKQDQA